ncbi:SdiA-regulated protein [Gillisia mitskevichiae]|uniref:SdiA-regulated protein n=1 Tax=Gillisia mitskevichiae TaxID=270921 RepID=A0A495PRX7_9FLAO|nr:SdiA-regulated domain-containing protein [Gillisia mitskevichiae]RKS53384.1 SdiA-regulated protein [Gillisia mitskevichiae]
MKTLKYASGIIIAVFALVAIFGFMILSKADDKEVKLNYTIKQIWELPKELREVSGIAWLEDGKIASVQDEDGIIFIYDLETEKITEQIDFAEGGDYEGIAINNNDAYILRSDGTLFEVLNYLDNRKVTNSFKTGFSSKNNIETLEIDKEHQNLIVAPKDRDNKDNFKGLYRIAINSKKMEAIPMVKIDMNDKVFNNENKKAYKNFNPSDMAIHPQTGEYYVLDGKNPKLVILDKAGTIIKIYKLDKNDFAQPEGITFSPNGILYISNEAGDNEANIIEIELK